MKKRIVALLLAGLLSASVLTMASCKKEAERPDGQIGTTTTGTGIGWPPNEPSVVWTEVNETVYVTAAMSLTPVDGGEQTTVKQMDILTRVRIGSDGRSVVVKNDKEYYATSRNLTNEDLEGYTFTPCNETWYVSSATLNVRRYASNASYSPIKGSYKHNDAVTVVAKGTSWCKIQYSATEQYFVHMEFLSTTKTVDPDDLSNYPAFNDGTPTTMYVNVGVVSGKVAYRKAPSKNATWLGDLPQDTAVTVVASNLVDGKLWCKVRIQIAADPSTGTSATTVTAFISGDCLSETQGSAAAKTLEEMLDFYTDFTRTEGVLTRYITESTNIRSTPELISAEIEGNNIMATVQKATPVKVVAMANAADADGIVWAMIEYAEGTYYFVSSKMLTTDPSGNPAAPTLSELLQTYQAFTACTEKTVYVIGKVNCNTTPTNEANPKQLGAGEAVTVVAQGTIDSSTWYIFRTQSGELFFADSALFTETAPAPAA